MHQNVNSRAERDFVFVSFLLLYSSWMLTAPIKKKKKKNKKKKKKQAIKLHLSQYLLVDTH